MRPRKAVIIDIPMKKFMDERPENRAIGRPGELTSTREGACATQALATVAGCATQALATAGVCTRRRGNGAMCGRPADGGRDECWLHAEWYSLLPAVFGMPYPEDAVSIYQILSRTMSLVIAGEMSPQKAQAVTKLCRELRRNLLWYQREMGMW